MRKKIRQELRARLDEIEGTKERAIAAAREAEDLRRHGAPANAISAAEGRRRQAAGEASALMEDLLKWCRGPLYRALSPGRCGPACKKLSRRHHDFVEALTAGGPEGQPLSQTDAYAAAYPTAKRTTCATGGEALMRKPDISAAVEQHRQAIAAEAPDLRQEADATLRELWRPGAFGSVGERVQAMRLHGQWRGWEAPKRVEVAGLPAFGELLALAKDPTPTGKAAAKLLAELAEMIPRRFRELLDAGAGDS